jgi:NAD-dependent deacetylase
MHGELAKSRCSEDCGAQPIEDRVVYANLSEVGHCACGARLRPHIVFFGEMPLEMRRIQQEMNRSTQMLVIGTSGSVYPAANFVHWARQADAFDTIVEGNAGTVMPELFAVESN